MSLSTLPRELVLSVADNLSTVFLTRLFRTCHSLHQLLGPTLTARITAEQLASTILKSGIKRNHLPTVQLALAHNAAWHTVFENGLCYSAIGHACYRGQIDTVAALITHYGPLILTEDHELDKCYRHQNALKTAIRRNNLALTTLLLEHGAPVNITGWYGFHSRYESPLDIAAKHGTAEIAEVLIKYGANVRRAKRSLDYAMDCENWAVVKLLMRGGVWMEMPCYEWSDRCPLTSRLPEEIDAWVAGAMEYMKTQRMVLEIKKDQGNGS